jgi:hypothetical protein
VTFTGQVIPNFPKSLERFATNVVPSVKHGVTKTVPNIVAGHKKEGRQQNTLNPTRPNPAPMRLGNKQQASKTTVVKRQAGTQQTPIKREVTHVNGTKGSEHTMHTGARRQPK